MQRTSTWNGPVLARLIIFVLLSAATAPASVRAKEISPLVVACHDEATQRYIADIRQVGLPEKRFDGFPIVVTTFQNDNPRFEEYVAECMKRSDREKVR
jgi:hypothetical protein